MLLNCHSYYSMRFGTLSISELIANVQKAGYNELVLTDVNNTSGWVEAMRQTKGLKHIKVSLGIDFRNDVKQQYVGIAKNNEGLKELSDHLAEHTKANTPFPEFAPNFKHVNVIYPITIDEKRALKPNEWLGVKITDLTKLDIRYKDLPKEKMVILHSVTFLNKVGHNIHRLLRAINHNVLGSQLQTHQYIPLTDKLISIQKLTTYFESYPQLIKNTLSLSNSSNIDFNFGKFANKNLAHYTTSKEQDIEKLREEAVKGAYYRYGKTIPTGISARIEKELDVINTMGYASYFLINWDILNYARKQNYFYVGRGSGANSLVAYLLRITDVDPVELNLYFERFINPYRSTPPDFDIDFSWRDREDITRYIFDTYNKNGTVALLGAYVTFKFDSATREIGKAFGLPPSEIDLLQRVKSINQITDQTTRQVYQYAQCIVGFPNHNSIHASGILISEKPIHYYSATFMPPKGFPTTHFSMIEAEDIGLYKFDILSQRGLGKIKDCLALVAENHNVKIDPHNKKLFTTDSAVKELLKKGKTIGCFYVESPAMRMLLSKLKADDYLRLVAASSIIRPGVSKSGMMREYILRFRYPHLREKAKKELPELYNLLEETYGVMVYQEDVIKIAHIFADLTLAEADYLRRGMSWKFKQRNEFHMVRKRFFDNCKKKGYADTTVQQIWNQIESFANFAFSKGHSASYAVESYQALYLKAYYPIEYLVATVNNGGGFYSLETYLHDAKMHGATILSPCVNTSNSLALLKDKTIYLGFGFVKELQDNTIYTLLAERQKNGCYTSLLDFIERVAISMEQLCLLIRIDAFRFTQKKSTALLWDAHLLLNKNSVNHSTSLNLFKQQAKQFTLPQLDTNPFDQAFTEMELFGFSKELPFNLLSESLSEGIKANEMNNYVGKVVSINGYLIHRKYTSTSNKQKMCFATFLDIDGHWIDTVHFPPSLHSFPFTGRGCYQIKGKVVEEFDFISLEVSYLKRLPYIDRSNTRLKPVDESVTITTIS